MKNLRMNPRTVFEVNVDFGNNNILAETIYDSFSVFGFTRIAQVLVSLRKIDRILARMFARSKNGRVVMNPALCRI